MWEEMGRLKELLCTWTLPFNVGLMEVTEVQSIIWLPGDAVLCGRRQQRFVGRSIALHHLLRMRVYPPRGNLIQNRLMI
jgi:hypothetical protein